MFATDEGPFERRRFQLSPGEYPAITPAVTTPSGSRTQAPGNKRSAMTSSRCIEAMRLRSRTADASSGRRKRNRWLKHTVVFDLCHGGERMRAHLTPPENGSPPPRPIVFFRQQTHFISNDPRHVACLGTSLSTADGPLSRSKSDCRAVGVFSDDRRRGSPDAW